MDLEEKIRNLIRKSGPVTFARFMEMALFDPEGGYYSAGRAADDYYTSPMAHPAFGALLALQIEQMWRMMGKPRVFTLVEMGAGRGLLAEDILDFIFRWSPSFYDCLRYIAIETGGQQNSKQQTENSQRQTEGSRQQTANSKPNGSRVESLGPRVRCQFIKTSTIPLKNITGCLLSNELLDAFPVHRLVKKQGKLEEIYVGLEEGRFAEVMDEPSSPELEKYLSAQKAGLEEGQTVEVNLAALHWLGQVSSSLERGYVITIDYGFEREQLYSRRFFQGTLLCYYQHNYTDNPYIRAGQQDITAHVNFTALKEEGEKLGLKALGLSSQSLFLGNLGLGLLLRALAKLGLPQKEHYANQFALRSLASPGQTGDFRVLVQGKKVADAALYGFTEDNDLLKSLSCNELPVPLLKPHHISLLQKSYPEYYYQF